MPYITSDIPIRYYKNSPLRLKIRWLMILRVIILTILLSSISILQMRYGYSRLSPFFMLIAVTYLLTILYSILYWYLSNLVVFSYIQLFGDVLIEICLIYLTGGIESTFSFTFIITIITASILLSRKGSLIIASMSSILYGLLLDLQYFEILTFPSSYLPVAKTLNSAYIFHTIFVNICAFYLTALLSGYLAESRKKANKALVSKEEDLEELKAFNEDVLKNMHSGLIVTDTEGKVTLLNTSAIESLDIKNFSNYTLFWNELFMPLDFFQIFTLLMNEPTKILTYNDFFKYGNNGTCFLGLKISLLQDSKGKTKGTITCLQDLTEFKNLEEEMKRNELLASIGSMAAGIAHELRNPLASIKGSIQLLAEGLRLEPVQENLFDIIIRESTRLNNIIDDFLLYAKPKPPILERCELNNLIVDILNILKNAEDFNNNIEIITLLEEDDPYIFLDINQIRQVFWNLLINACQAMPDGGTLKVKGFTKTTGKQNKKIIEFIDTGGGISKEGYKRLFHPFYTTKENGTGLGLCIAYRIIEAHNGEIEVESNLNKGSLFRISLPIGQIP